jgi:hypothetical protein
MLANVKSTPLVWKFGRRDVNAAGGFL